VVEEIREAELIAVERELGVAFPVDYRTFVVVNEGGTAISAGRG
jgi:hypothetical protein